MEVIEEDVPKASVPKTDAAESSNSALIIDGTALVNEIQINLDVLRNILQLQCSLCKSPCTRSKSMYRRTSCFWKQT